MKLEGLALAAIVLAATLSTACASGTSETSDHGGGGGGAGGEGEAGGIPSEGSDAAGGAPSAEEAGVFDSGAPTKPDTGNPFATPEAGGDGAVKTPATDGGPDPACAAEGTQSACAECCGSASPEGITTLNAAIVSCACGTSGGCATACASEVCADIPATEGDACYACLSALLGTSGACYLPVQTACEADPGCAAYLSCESSECSSLP